MVLPTFMATLLTRRTENRVRMGGRRYEAINVFMLVGLATECLGIRQVWSLLTGAIVYIRKVLIGVLIIHGVPGRSVRLFVGLQAKPVLLYQLEQFEEIFDLIKSLFKSLVDIDIFPESAAWYRSC